MEAILERNRNAGIVPPLKILVMESPDGGVMVRYHDPVDLFAPYAGVGEVAEELRDVFRGSSRHEALTPERDGSGVAGDRRRAVLILVAFLRRCGSGPARDTVLRLCGVPEGLYTWAADDRGRT